jgi:hypothetical protein
MLDKTTIAEQIEAGAQTRGFRPVLIRGDATTPTFRSGDYAIVAPCAGYDGEGVYLLQDGGLFRVQPEGDGFVLVPENTRYMRQSVSAAWFPDNVAGRVIAACNWM